MRYRWIHECEKPSMVVGTESVKEYRRHWLFFNKVVEHLENVYEEKTVRWNCPVCQSQWEWTGRIWWCLQRPEIWKDYNDTVN